MEQFAKPAAAAIIRKEINGEEYLLIQEREKEEGGSDNGLLEIPAGKIREYENVFDALRREVFEETGLVITKIEGEEESVCTTINGNTIVSFQPYCMTQNLAGAYSLLVHTFLCRAEGELLKETNETKNIRWEKAEDVRKLLISEPESIFLLHINALKQYLGI